MLNGVETISQGGFDQIEEGEETSPDSSQTIEEIVGRLRDPDLDVQHNARSVLEFLDDAQPFLLAPVNPYVPFDAQTELSEIKAAKMNTEERRERLEQYKANLVKQNLAVAELTGELKNSIEENPNANRGRLFAKVLAAAEECRFSYYVFSKFASAIRAYGKKHAAVEKAHEHRSPEALYEECFGAKPAGKVEVVKGPMTLCFRLFDRADYAFAYNVNSKNQNVAKNPDSEEFKKAHSSSGAAFSSVLRQDLAGCVTVVNESIFMTRGVEEKTTSFDKGTRDFSLHPGEGDVEINVAGIGSWSVESTEWEEGTQVIMKNSNKPKSKPIFEVTIPKKSTSGYSTEALETGELERNGKVYGKVEVSPHFTRITVSNSSGREISVKHYDYGKARTMHMEGASDRVRSHEDQHQFNKLFKPFEPRMVTSGLSSVGRDPEHGGSLYGGSLVDVQNWARLERRTSGIDSQARDEILAHYKGGERTLAQIVESLTNSKLYNYPKTLKIGDDLEILGELDKEIQEAGKGYRLPLNQRVAAREEIRSIMMQSGTEYRNNVAEWVASIATLETKGYSRDEVVNLLSCLPINSWSSEARRVPAKV